MKYNEKMAYLCKKLDDDISRIKKKSDDNKNRAFFMSLASVIFGACVTIFLGLRLEALENIFKNIALVCGVAATVIGSIEMFFNHKGLWVKQKVTLLQLYSLRNKIEFYQAGFEDSDKIDEEKLTEFFTEYSDIWQGSTEEWKRMRTEQKQEESKSVNN